MKDIQQFLNSIVRTVNSKSVYPKAPELTVDEWVLALNSCQQYDVDTDLGALLPPRLTFYHDIPSSLEENFEKIVSGLKSTKLHPATLHALTAIAIDAQPYSRKLERTKALAEFLNTHQHTQLYPVDAIMLSAIHPEYFETSKSLTLSLTGLGLGGDVEHKNSMLTLNIRREHLKINSSNIFTSKLSMPVCENYYFDNLSDVADTAARAFHGKRVLNNNFWIMGYGDKALFEHYITPVAALLSPHYTLEDIDNVVKYFNQLSQDVDGLSYTSGVQDVYPNLQDNSVFLDYFHPLSIEAQPFSKNLIEIIAEALVSDKNSFMVSAGFIKRLYENLIQLDMLDLIPEYSVFHKSKDGYQWLSLYSDKEMSVGLLKPFIFDLLNKQSDVDYDILKVGELPGTYLSAITQRNKKGTSYEQNM